MIMHKNIRVVMKYNDNVMSHIAHLEKYLYYK